MQLAEAQPTPVEQLQDQQLAGRGQRVFGGPSLRRLEHLPNVALRQVLRQALLDLGRPNGARGIGLEALL